MDIGFSSIIHVRTELPFPLVLPSSEILFCWEPKANVAAFIPEGIVGSVQWHRCCGFLTPEEVYGESPLDQDESVYLSRPYRMSSHLKNRSSNLVTAQLLPGKNGGFIEARPYTVSNLFLLDYEKNINTEEVLSRATESINNIIGVHQLLSIDPLLRPIKIEGDAGVSLIMKASVPEGLTKATPIEILKKLTTFEFSNADGGPIIPTNSIEDLLGHKLGADGLIQLSKLVRTKKPTELFHELFLSSIRKLKRGSAALAIIDAQSAFETAVASMLRDALKEEKLRDEQIDKQFSKELHLLKLRLKKIDEIAGRYTKERFLGSTTGNNWDKCLYKLRNEIVHGGKRSISFTEGKKGIVAGLKAVKYLHNLCPLFARKVMWAENALDLPHIRETAGRLSRFIEY